MVEQEGKTMSNIYKKAQELMTCPLCGEKKTSVISTPTDKPGELEYKVYCFWCGHKYIKRIERQNDDA